MSLWQKVKGVFGRIGSGIGHVIKSAAPVIGGVVGSFVGGPVGTAVGSGIGRVVQRI